GLGTADPHAVRTAFRPTQKKSPDDAIATAAPKAAASGLWDTFKSTGHKTFEFKWRKKSGDAPQFTPGYIRNEFLELAMVGVAGATTVNVELNESSLESAAEKRNRITLINPNFRLVYGDFQSDFSRQELLVFEDQMEGLSMDVFGGGHSAGLLLSEQRGKRDRDQFFGNDSQGPFQLRFFPVLPGTEQLKVTGIMQVRDVDYRIDYVAGTIVFLKRILTPDQEIVVEYESQLSVLGARILGGKYQYAFSPSSSVGVYVMQKQGSDAAAVGSAVYSNREVGLLAVRQSWGTIALGGEVALSRYTPDLQYPTPSIGLAVAAQAENQQGPWRHKVHYKRLSAMFESIHRVQIGPGDFSYGLESQWSADESVLGGQWKKDRYRLTDVPIEEEVFREKAGHKLGPVTVGLTGLQSRRAEVGTVVQLQNHYRQSAYEGTLSSAVGSWGTAQAKLGVENRQNTVQQDLSYTSRLASLGYSYQPIEALEMAVTGRIKDQKLETNAQLLEKAVQVASIFRLDRRTDFSGTAEWVALTGQPLKTIYTVRSRWSPGPVLDLRTNASLESLNETYNNYPLDLDRFEGNFRADIEPIPSLRFNYGLKPKFKQTRLSRLPILSKTDQSLEGSWSPISWLQLSGLTQQIRDSRLQMTFYPDAVYESGVVLTDVHVARLRTRPLSNVQFNLQGSFDKKQVGQLVATSDPALSWSPESLIKLQADTAWQLWSYEWGMEYVHSRQQLAQPYALYRVEDAYGTSIQTTYFSALTVRPGCKWIRTTESDVVYGAIEPSLQLNYRMGDRFLVDAKYQFRTDYRPTGTTNNRKFEGSTKVSVHENVVGTVGVAWENHVDPTFETLEVSAKVTVVF
ncbi:MAG: hypothetical protein AAB066_01935, partial [Candidatus Margulisiibacteriota bacterium]